MRATECTILAPSDPALSLWLRSICLGPALVGIRGRDVEMREAIGKLWVAKDGREGQRDGSGGVGLFDVWHGGRMC